MSVPLLELRGVRFAYPHHPELFRDLELCLEAGERLCLAGANGAGKSTLLLLALGLLEPAAGELRCEGRAVVTEADRRQLRQRLGLVFQDPDDQLFCPTVLEDVAFGPLNLGQSPAASRAAAEEALEQVGMGGFAPRLTHELSGGEKRLISLATVLAMQPRGLLLDEPTNGLDEAHRRRIIDLLAGMPRALLVVSHDAALVEALGGRRLRLLDGAIA